MPDILTIRKKLLDAPPFQQLRKGASGLGPGDRLTLTGVAGSLPAFVAALLFESRKSPVLVVARDEDAAQKLRDDCALLVAPEAVRLFPTRPIHQGQSLDMSAEIAQIETLRALAAGTRSVVVGSPAAMVENVPSPGAFRQSVMDLHQGADTGFQQLIDDLERLGFERKEFVETFGDVAVRGGIVDVYPFIGENPVRLEFWGDRIESIREFDVLSQRSIRKLTTVSIVPDVLNDTDAPRSATIFDYLPPETLLVLDEPESIRREIDELRSEGARLPAVDLEVRMANFAVVAATAFTSVRAGDEGESTVAFEATAHPSLNGNVNALVESIGKFSADGLDVYIGCETARDAARLKDLIDEALTVAEAPAMHGEIVYETLEGSVHDGFVMKRAGLVVLTEHETFGRLKRRGYGKRRRFKGFSEKDLHQLKPGDFIVHVDHGIGTYAGLVKLRVAGTEHEAIKLLFLEDDVLYVNLNFIDRVQKYSSQEGHVPPLSKLGTAEWGKTTARAKKRIKELARDLIQIYARRKSEQGFAFASDSHWQKELEASFMYEDTVDQAAATQDVKHDMESPSPMDRLVCGDVGFGKTEVAVRAAFKAVMDGKQVAVLVPTTILAMQHYNTFVDRLARYSTRIEHLSRFRSQRDQKVVLEGMKSGSVDIVIGTHRLLSKDIGFKDLGLLVIDEEHRFGVAAKEKLRTLKSTVDTLALTATPIPRTLHFSLIGARDLSLIATPPRNRLPIVTEIIPADTRGRRVHWEVVREATVRELHRGGQLYVVHDRIDDIELIADRVRAEVPGARVHIAHGQMEGRELEKTMMQFLERKHDVLVCTKIIESGLDIPNVNTIVINRADRFGLAELYQLRGRVGRSNIQAYAYLLTPPLSSLPKPTLRRLQAIEEFTELGSGFNLAMRDLEIRGAGNLLGAEQSGFVLEMGFEMYERIVREAVEELRRDEFADLSRPGPAPETEIRTVVDADIDALIPDVYVESSSERLDIYRRLYRERTAEQIQRLREELIDRFGEYPEEVEHLIRLVELRLKAAALGLQKVEVRRGMLTLTLPDQANLEFYGTAESPGEPFQRLVTYISSHYPEIRLKEEAHELKVSIRFDDEPAAAARLDAAMAALARVQTVIDRKADQ